MKTGKGEIQMAKFSATVKAMKAWKQNKASLIDTVRALTDAGYAYRCNLSSQKWKLKLAISFYCKNGGPLMMVKGVASSFGDGLPSTLHLVWFNADNDIENVTMPIECLITEKDTIAKWEAERAEALERGKKKFVDSNRCRCNAER